MINIKVSLKDGHAEIIADGHANFNPGNDPVCSAVSAIIQTAVLGLQAVANTYPDHVKIEEVR